jgi:hypothetical protein
VPAHVFALGNRYDGSLAKTCDFYSAPVGTSFTFGIDNTHWQSPGNFWYVDFYEDDQLRKRVDASEFINNRAWYTQGVNPGYHAWYAVGTDDAGAQRVPLERPQDAGGYRSWSGANGRCHRHAGAP